MKALLKFTLQVLYNIGFMTFFFITGPFFLWRLWRRGKLLPQFGQRFGLYSEEVRERLVPGADFGFHAPRDYIRVSYATAYSKLEEAIERLGTLFKV